MSDNATILTVCPHCRRKYRVLARFVPPQGVRARCPHCRAVFSIVPRVTPSATSPRMPAPVPPGERPAAPGAVAPDVQVSTPAAAAAVVSTPEAAAAVAAAPAGAEGAPRPTWSSDLERARPARGAIGEVRPRPLERNGHTDPSPFGLPTNGSQDASHANARSLARALASDLAAYHPEECRTGHDTGKLVKLLAAEIARSWEMYNREVGPEIASGTPYFREALNEFLACGERYF
ncbi:MAG: zinc-ribbon domain-containing protein [Candidatus Eisenbacteria bacterium]|nr:zinc-ribbon domain-containing protein [Candidatus Eisenbacteria bacterium]